MARKYVLRRRAERMEETRQKIVQAAVELHQTVGPEATMSAVAERAGVQRHTLYRYFPDALALFGACSTRYREANPPPDPSAWLRIVDPGSRLRTALTAAYGYYGRNEAMMANVLRAAQTMPVGGAILRHRAQMVDVAAQGWSTQNGRQKRLIAALRIAFDFHTWRSLVREDGLGEGAAIDLMVGFVEHAAGLD